ncbi:cytochrome c3 family protein [Geopsychrobacter electrodiphilus]|uniref:cytochrome c3 family protein n=1 Tax=Geopsychrobacter electrodiphilus TaxID=225196 RepID=UPI00036B800C|nr:cytochrome c3 family protein [Geopsychrobacter electrodiphilus]
MTFRICSQRLILNLCTACVFGLLIGSALTCPAQGFHEGGVGNCNGCHSMHSAKPGSQQLLLSSDPSSICLNCHAGAGGPNSPSVFSPDGSALTPGGDFYWLTRSYSWLDGSSPAADHGHNIVAIDYGLLSDPVLSTSPGGSFPSAALGCTSCHDPHGQVGGGTPRGSLPITRSGSYGDVVDIGGVNGNYRLLGDSRYTPANGPAFQANAPAARQSSVNRFEETDSSHVAYGAGMSEWCGNCHGDLLHNAHQVAGSSFVHPSGSGALLTPALVSTYNSYLRTGDLSGVASNAYLQFVPFERGTSNLQLLDPNSTQGPEVTSTVMCLTCHRAHASAFPKAGRWDFNAVLLVDSHPKVGDMGGTAGDVYASYYGRDIALEFGSGQGSFCEKCHGSTTP